MAQAVPCQRMHPHLEQAEPIYGDTAQDAGDKVRISVELMHIDRLEDTYSLDIQYLKGNLRSYKFLYDTIRECMSFTCVL